MPTVQYIILSIILNIAGILYQQVIKGNKKQYRVDFAEALFITNNSTKKITMLRKVLSNQQDLVEIKYLYYTVRRALAVFNQIKKLSDYLIPSRATLLNSTPYYSLLSIFTALYTTPYLPPKCLPIVCLLIVYFVLPISTIALLLSLQRTVLELRIKPINLIRLIFFFITFF